MEQAKALNALEPFLALSKSATSPRIAADLVVRATSAPNTFVFAELLQTPQISSLANTPDYASYYQLLQIFSYGTYEAYQTAAAASGLPPLTDAQTLKLRQLSLLTLARDRDNLSYEALQRHLGLSSTRELEDLLIAAIYAGLLNATLDPARQTVQVSSTAPLRDLAPGAIPDLVSALKLWSDRCTNTLTDIDAQIQRIRSAAVVREREKRKADEKLKAAISDADKKSDIPPNQRDMLARRANFKRTMTNPQAATAATANDSMELDEPVEEEKKRVNKRKM